MTCRRRPSSEEEARVSPGLQGDNKAPVPEVGQESMVIPPLPWEDRGRRGYGPGLEADGSGGQRAQELLSSTGCGEQEEDEEEEEEEGSCYSEEGEDGGNVY
ncbi:hypothetical protein N333_06491, partial [Nestor notabilis]